MSMLSGAELARCFLIEMNNGIQDPVRMTSHDVDIVVGLNTYLKTPGFTLSRYTVSNGGEPATLDIEIPFSEDGPVYVEHVRRGAWRGATMVVWIAHTGTPSVREILAEGYVGLTDFSDRLKGKMELVTLADALKDVILFTIQPACPFKFASRQCGVVEATYTRAGTVTSVTNRRKFTANITSPGALNFTHGKVTWVTGDNDDSSGWVRQWNSGSELFDMVTDAPFDIQVGDTFNVLSGCKKNRTDCAFYDNIDRYAGFDYVAR